MALGDGVRARLAELAKKDPILSQRIADCAREATYLAVERAVELTPPNTFEEGEARGAHMITGKMAQSWRSDSIIEPDATGGLYRTILGNNVKTGDSDDDVEYASYVNDGHRVDKHFVPGLYIDPATGLLSMDPAKPKGVGLMVGTKTTYVEGLHITDAAKEVYEKVLDEELDKLTREVFE